MRASNCRHTTACSSGIRVLPDGPERLAVVREAVRI